MGIRRELPTYQEQRHRQEILILCQKIENAKPRINTNATNYSLMLPSKLVQRAQMQRREKYRAMELENHRLLKNLRDIARKPSPFKIQAGLHKKKATYRHRILPVSTRDLSHIERVETDLSDNLLSYLVASPPSVQPNPTFNQSVFSKQSRRVAAAPGNLKFKQCQALKNRYFGYKAGNKIEEKEERINELLNLLTSSPKSSAKNEKSLPWFTTPFEHNVESIDSTKDEGVPWTTDPSPLLSKSFTLEGMQDLQQTDAEPSTILKACFNQKDSLTEIELMNLEAAEVDSEYEETEFLKKLVDELDAALEKASSMSSIFCSSASDRSLL